MHFTNKDISKLDKIKRLNLINSINGFKSANLIGTKGHQDIENLAIFSSVTHFGSNPPILGMVTRPLSVPRHTHRNIMETGFYTINHIHIDHIDKAHQSSANYEDGVSEFKACGFAPEYLNEFKAPYVKESIIKIGMKFEEEYPIKINGTLLILGSIVDIHLPEDVVSDEYYINLEKAGTAAISGLNSYYKTEKIKSIPFARV